MICSQLSANLRSTCESAAELVLAKILEWEADRDNHRLGSHVGVEAIANRELTMDDLFT